MNLTSRQTAIRCGIAVTTLLLILIMLPIGAGWYGEQWLRDNGASNATIGNVDINLFTGVARVENLNAGGGEDDSLRVGVAEIDIQWWPLASKRLRVRSLRLEDADIDLRQRDDGALQIGAIVIPTAEVPAADAAVEIESSDPWGLGSDVLRIENVRVYYHHPIFDTNMEAREIYLGSHYSWAAGEVSDVRVDVLVNGSPLQIGGTVQPWGDSAGFDGSLNVDALTLSDFADTLSEFAGLTEPRGSVSLDLEARVSFSADEGFALSIEGPLSLSGTGFSVAGYDIAQDSVKWDGEVDLRLPASSERPLLELAGAITATGSAVTAEQFSTNARLDELQWQGDIRFTPPLEADSEVSLQAANSLTLAGLSIKHSDLPGTVLSFDSLNVPEIDVSSLTSAGIPALTLANLRALSPGGDAASGADVLAIETIQLDRVSLDDTTLAIGSVQVSQPAIDITRNADGVIRQIDPALAALQEMLTANTSGQSAAGNDDTEATAVDAFTVTIDQATIAANNIARFVDNAVNPPARFQLRQLNATAKNIDLSGAAAANVEFELGDGNMTLVGNGTTNPFAQPRTLSMKATLRALDLSQLSNYLTAYNIERGRLNSDTTIEISGDDLDAQNDLLIERLKLSSKAGGESDVLSEGLAMPLDVALDLLRNSEDEIELALPVTGSLSAPEFGTGDILRLAMQKALQRAALSYAKNALQPLGTILFVGNLASKAARPRFEPVTLPAGSADLPEKARAYLQKVGELLNERPGIDITLCGVAVPGDRAAMLEARSQVSLETNAKPPAMTDPEPITEAEMLALAAQRTQAVIDYLTETESIDAGRLFTCRETVETDEAATPRTEIYL